MVACGDLTRTTGGEICLPPLPVLSDRVLSDARYVTSALKPESSAEYLTTCNRERNINITTQSHLSSHNLNPPVRQGYSVLPGGEITMVRHLVRVVVTLLPVLHCVPKIVILLLLLLLLLLPLTPHVLPDGPGCLL